MSKRRLLDMPKSTQSTPECKMKSESTQSTPECKMESERRFYARRVKDYTNEIAALKAALADLHAVQNGPPLIRDEAIWQSAMDNAERLLGLAAQRREGE